MRPRRKKLLHVCLTVALVVLAGQWIADSMRIKYRRPDDRRARLGFYAYQHTRLRADIIFLGSSLTRYAVVSRALERQLKDAALEASVFNLGRPEVTSLQAAIILRDMIGSNGCPEMIVLEVSAQSLNAGHDQTNFISDYASFSDLPLLAPELLSLAGADAFLSSRLRGLLALYYRATKQIRSRHYKRALRRAGSRWASRDLEKYEELDRRAALRRLAKSRRWATGRFLIEFEVGATPVRGLEAVTRLASDCESRLLLLRFPTILPLDTKDLRRIRGEFEDFAQSFSRRSGVPLYKIDPGDIGLEYQHYQDFMHLNPAGAMRFTAFLAEHIIGPELRAARAPRS